MRQQRAGSGRRDRGLVWGFVAVILLVTVVSVWLGHPTATDDVAFGRVGAVTTDLIAIVATTVAAVVSYVPADTSSGLRWGITLPVAVIAAAVAVLAFGSLFAPQHVTELALGALLLVAAVAMTVVATEVGRRRLPPVRGHGSQPKESR